VSNVDLSKIASVTFDGPPSMTVKELGFVSLFIEHMVHLLLGLHFIHLHKKRPCVQKILSNHLTL